MQKLWIKISLSIALLSSVALLSAQDNKGKFMLGTAQYFKQTKKPNLPTYNISTNRTWDSRYSFSYFVRNRLALGVLVQYHFERFQNYNDPTNGFFENNSKETYYFALQANWFMRMKNKALLFSLNPIIGYGLRNYISNFQRVIPSRKNMYEGNEKFYRVALYPSLHLKLKPNWEINVSTLYTSFSIFNYFGNILQQRTAFFDLDLSLNLLFGVNYYF